MPTQAALDLCWAINSPSLVDGEHVATPHPIAIDSVNEGHLDHFLSTQPESMRVGRYFENLVHYWLAHVRRVEVVETGLQLKDGKITVGEIDFLYRNEQGELVHLETSVKFFLHAPGLTPSEFPGPNARDNFEAKATKLFDKQLPASDGRVDGIDVREGLVKGMIFRPTSTPDIPTPARLAPGHLTGRWLRADALPELEALGDTFSIVDKPNWLAPRSNAHTLTFGELASSLAGHFSKTGHPLMLSVRNAASPGVESHRCFVVSESWPSATAPQH